MYRLYIDETGNADLKASDDPNHRFLSLTGVIMSLDHVRERVFPDLEALKVTAFGSHPDSPVILHRKDMIAKKHPFKTLRDAAAEDFFNRRFLRLLREIDYTALTVVIDKLEHRTRYKVWRYDPYHYCLEMLLERYVRWLRNRNGRGDVLAEVRGGKPDRRLERCYSRIYQEGTDFLRPSAFSTHLTSRNLKLKRKAENVAGLQIADVLAHPSAEYVRSHYLRRQPPQSFGAKIASILVETKYDRSPAGKIEGWGIKWLP